MDAQFISHYAFQSGNRSSSGEILQTHRAPWTKTTKVVRWFLLTNRQFQEVGHCRRHISGPIVPKFYVEFENTTSSCDNLRPCRN